MERLTRQQAAVIGAYTGIACGPFGDIHEYIEKVLGRPVWTHELASRDMWDKIKTATNADFMDLCAEEA